jgi:outer membrane protein TolC
MRHGSSILVILGISFVGCAGVREHLSAVRSGAAPLEDAPMSRAELADPPESQPADIQAVEFEQDSEASPQVDAIPTKDAAPLATGAEDHAAGEAENPPPSTLQLDAVVSSVYANFPLLEAARFQRNVANGDILSANGNFDTKLKAASENGALGFYQTNRNSIGVSQPLYGGAEVFGGYRVGRGKFEPWYQERQTNGNGEFKGGIQVPLARNRQIDARRAELWKATYARDRTEPEIQAQLIEFIRDGSLQYWEWVAAGQKQEVADRLLKLAVDRNEGIRLRVKAGDLDPPDADDNQRIIVSREAKVIDAARKSTQSAVKLSLFYRDDLGRPVIPATEWVPQFPEPEPVSDEQMSSDIQMALNMRPELQAIDILQREIDVDYAAAQNDFRPQVDALVTGSQDSGTPTSSKNDKGPFELEAGIYAEVPIQRRKARGKMSAIEAKVSQITAKRRMLEDKIATEIQSTHAALSAAWQRVGKARESVRLARYMADVEQKKFDAGSSDLLLVNLREQQAAEAAETEIDALLDYHQARAVYRAAMAQDHDD